MQKIAGIRTAKTNKTVKTARRTSSNMAGTMTNKKKRPTPAPTKRALDVFVPPSSTDVNGSYTGVPKNKREMPIQDADDL